MGYWNISVGVIRAVSNHSANKLVYYSMSNERRAAANMSMVVQGGLVAIWTRSGGVQGMRLHVSADVDMYVDHTLLFSNRIII